MVREDRRISVDFTETYNAIFALCAKQGMPRPLPGSIAAITVKDNDDNRVVVTIANGLHGTAATSEYSRDLLAASLVLYCRTCGIPVPRKGRKSVEPGGASVTLRILL